MSTTAPQPRYTAGQVVEVFGPDFTDPFMPNVWQPATVVSVDYLEDCKLFDIAVRMPNGTIRRERVGRRGGNKRVRP